MPGQRPVILQYRSQHRTAAPAPALFRLLDNRLNAQVWMIYAQRLQLRQIVKVLLFTAAPVDGDIAIWITRQRRQQNRADIGEARATGNQDQRTVFVFTQRASP